MEFLLNTNTKNSAQKVNQKSEIRNKLNFPIENCGQKDENYSGEFFNT